MHKLKLHMPPYITQRSPEFDLFIPKNICKYSEKCKTETYANDYRKNPLIGLVPIFSNWEKKSNGVYSIKGKNKT